MGGAPRAGYTWNRFQKSNRASTDLQELVLTRRQEVETCRSHRTAGGEMNESAGHMPSVIGPGGIMSSRSRDAAAGLHAPRSRRDATGGSGSRPVNLEALPVMDLIGAEEAASSPLVDAGLKAETVELRRRGNLTVGRCRGLRAVVRQVQDRLRPTTRPAGESANEPAASSRTDSRRCRPLAASPPRPHSAYRQGAGRAGDQRLAAWSPGAQARRLRLCRPVQAEVGTARVGQYSGFGALNQASPLNAL